MGLQEFLVGSMNAFLNNIEGKMAKVQSAFVDMLGLEWAIGTRRLDFMQNIKIIIELIAIIKAINSILASGRIADLCSDSTAKMILDIISRQSPDTIEVASALTGEDDQPSNSTGESEQSLTQGSSSTNNKISVDLSGCQRLREGSSDLQLWRDQLLSGE